MLSAKQQPSNIKHDGAIRPNVCKLTFGPPCINVIKENVYDTNMVNKCVDLKPKMRKVLLVRGEENIFL